MCAYSLVIKILLCDCGVLDSYPSNHTCIMYFTFQPPQYTFYNSTPECRTIAKSLVLHKIEITIQLKCL